MTDGGDKKTITYRCGWCSYNNSTGSKKFLAHYEEHHKKELAHWCKECGSHAETPASLVAHIKQSCNKKMSETLFTCGVERCKYSKQDPSKFVDHIRSSHKGTHLLPCKQCNKLFTIPSLLIEHIQKEWQPLKSSHKTSLTGTTEKSTSSSSRIAEIGDKSKNCREKTGKDKKHSPAKNDCATRDKSKHSSSETDNTSDEESDAVPSNVRPEVKKAQKGLNCTKQKENLNLAPNLVSAQEKVKEKKHSPAKNGCATREKSKNSSNETDNTSDEENVPSDVRLEVKKAQKGLNCAKQKENLNLAHNLVSAQEKVDESSKNSKKKVGVTKAKLKQCSTKSAKPTSDKSENNKVGKKRSAPKSKTHTLKRMKGSDDSWKWKNPFLDNNEDSDLDDPSWKPDDSISTREPRLSAVENDFFTDDNDEENDAAPLNVRLEVKNAQKGTKQKENLKLTPNLVSAQKKRPVKRRKKGPEMPEKPTLSEKRSENSKITSHSRSSTTENGPFSDDSDTKNETCTYGREKLKKTNKGKNCTKDQEILKHAPNLTSPVKHQQVIRGEKGLAIPEDATPEKKPDNLKTTCETRFSAAENDSFSDDSDIVNETFTYEREELEKIDKSKNCAKDKEILKDAPKSMSPVMHQQVIRGEKGLEIPEEATPSEKKSENSNMTRHSRSPTVENGPFSDDCGTDNEFFTGREELGKTDKGENCATDKEILKAISMLPETERNMIKTAEATTLFEKKPPVYKNWNKWWYSITENKCSTTLKLLQQDDNYLRNFFKCMGYTCYFSSNDEKEFVKHQTQEHLCEKLACLYCLDKYEAGVSLMEHTVSVHGMCNHQCSRCIYRASSKNHVQVHSKHVHPGKPNSYECDYVSQPGHIVTSNERKAVLPYICGLCSGAYQTYDREVFLFHNQELHSGVSTYPCFYCGTENNNLDALLKHFCSHGIYDYYCPYCTHGGDVWQEIRLHICLNHAEKPLEVGLRYKYPYESGCKPDSNNTYNLISERATDSTNNSQHLKVCKSPTNMEMENCSCGQDRYLPVGTQAVPVIYSVPKAEAEIKVDMESDKLDQAKLESDISLDVPVDSQSGPSPDNMQEVATSSDLEKSNCTFTGEVLEEKVVCCSLCLKPFDTHQALLLHQHNEHTNTQPAIVSDDCVKTESFDKPRLCYLCGYITTEKDKFKEHLYQEFTYTPLHCGMCCFKEVSREVILQHINDTHPGAPETTCREQRDKGLESWICSFISGKSKTEWHRASESAKQEGYPCTVCAMPVASNESYKQHLADHWQYQPHACLSCNEKFFNIEDAYAHVSAHHTGTCDIISTPIERIEEWIKENSRSSALSIQDTGASSRVFYTEHTLEFSKSCPSPREPTFTRPCPASKKPTSTPPCNTSKRLAFNRPCPASKKPAYIPCPASKKLMSTPSCSAKPIEENSEAELPNLPSCTSHPLQEGNVPEYFSFYGKARDPIDLRNVYLTSYPLRVSIPVQDVLKCSDFNMCLRIQSFFRDMF